MVVKAKGISSRGKGAIKGSTLKAKLVEKQEGKRQRQSGNRGEGLKFTADAYDLISRCTSKTRIKYVANPKRPGSKSFVRYKKYEKSKTVGEALKHCKPADLLWEYERKMLTILGGPMSDKPACMLPPSSDPAVQILAHFRGPHGCSIKMDPDVRKKLAKLAVDYGMDLDKIHEEAGKQCNSESADIQTARIIADEMAKRKLAATKHISEKDVIDVLQIWGFPDNETRLNVLPEGVKSIHSDTLGVLRLRNGTYRIFDPTIRYHHVTKLICQYFIMNKGKDIPDDFGFTGININHNYAGRRHRDGNNEGPSAIKALGKFTGGKLDYFPKDLKKSGRPEVSTLDPKDSVTLDLSKSCALFNGNNAHGVQPFKGERFSLVFFTTGKFYKIKEKEMKHLQKLGFKVPTIKSMNNVKQIVKNVDEKRAKTRR